MSTPTIHEPSEYCWNCDRPLRRRWGWAICECGKLYFKHSRGKPSLDSSYPPIPERLPPPPEPPPPPPVGSLSGDYKTEQPLEDLEPT